MANLGLSSEQQALIDSVSGALASRGERTADAVCADLQIGALQKPGGSLLEAALVAEVDGREGEISFPVERIPS